MPGYLRYVLLGAASSALLACGSAGDRGFAQPNADAGADASNGGDGGGGGTAGTGGTSSGGSESGGSGGEQTPDSSAGGSGGTDEDGGTAGDSAVGPDAAEAGIPVLGEPGQSGVDLVSGGAVLVSDSYTLVLTVGQSPGGNTVYTSPSYRLESGLVGSTQ